MVLPVGQSVNSSDVSRDGDLSTAESRPISQPVCYINS